MSLLPLCLATALAAIGPDADLAAAVPAAIVPPPATAAPSAAPASPAIAPAPAPDRLKLLGLMASGGVPDGGVVSLVVRPVKWVRADAGYAYDYFNSGVQGGVTLVPFHWAIVPTLRGEAGRFFRTNVSSKVKRFGEVPSYMEPFLGSVGYDYASVQLGLEMGSQRAFVFFLRGGLAWVKGSLGDGAIEGSSPSTQVSVNGLTLRASGPTASLGFLFYVW
jgi:hypothetical protein